MRELFLTAKKELKKKYPTIKVKDIEYYFDILERNPTNGNTPSVELDNDDMYFLDQLLLNL